MENTGSGRAVGSTARTAIRRPSQLLYFLFHYSSIPPFLYSSLVSCSFLSTHLAGAHLYFIAFI